MTPPPSRPSGARAEPRTPAGNGNGAGTSRLTDALRRADDVIPANSGHDGFRTDERLLIRHVVRLDEALAQLGDNLSRRHAAAESAG